MLCVETIGKIRRWHRIEKLSISQIARRLGASRNTVKKYLKSDVTRPRYGPRPKRFPVMGPWAARLLELLSEDARKPLRERRNGQRLFDTLIEEGFPGSYPTLQRAVRAWKGERERGAGQVFIPLAFAPGEAYQFDWSYETVELGGQVQQVKVAHLRLAHSRVFLAVGYLREAQEMVFDAHWRAFRLWDGVPRRGIYDNLKTAIDLIFVGKERQYNRRFLQMASHYLIEPMACTPAAGWEKGQVENQVGHVREQVFTPRLKAADLAELNALLERRCLEIAQRIPHPEQRERTRWEVYEAEERPALLPLPAAPYDGFAEREVRVSSTALVHYDRNRYSVDCRWAGKTVSVRAYADRIVMVADGAIVGEHGRSFERERTFFDPWHYVPALATKPGALRNGAPFRDWPLPESILELRERLLKKLGGDRQFVMVLNAIRSDGLEAVTVACELALEAGTPSSDYVLNALNRLKPQPTIAPVATPAELRLKQEPRADVGRYDALLKKLTLAALITLPVLAASEMPHGSA
ncbi:MAG TPA: IS21 family transposase [Burkholderiales bacterium]|nr:IS21 family transposase [Burkholderiales bacterium]